MAKSAKRESHSIWNRRMDLLYLVFFCTHVPVMFAFDLTHLYPTWLKQTWMTDVRTWYVATYADQFFVSPPAWFTLYSLLELALHVPLTLYFIPTLYSPTKSRSPYLPLLLLVFALETVITTATCMVEMGSWEMLTARQRGVQGLGGMYGGYLVLGCVMAVDAFVRCWGLLGRVGRDGVEGKKRV